MADRSLDPLEKQIAELLPASPGNASESCPSQMEALALVDGTLDAASAARVEAHLASCASCRGAAIDYSRAGGGEAAATRRGPRRLWLAAAAVLVVAVGVGFAVLSSSRPPLVEVEMRLESTRDAAPAKVGDGFHLDVRPQSSAIFYAALLYDADGTCTSLVPTNATLGPPLTLEAGIERRLPLRPDVFVFGDHPGEVSLLAFSATKPLPAGEWATFLERLTHDQLNPLIRDFLDRHRGSSLSLSKLTIVR
ncbi:MAG: zf-HC2 domain-containing protein [Planctomycetes bacterium]|nr:zf-HC2 domain-containing protein [Planctomycetota bacterium]